VKFQCVLFDVIGTTVKEKDSNTILKCFAKAFSDNGVDLDIDYIRKNRGNDNKKMIAWILDQFQLPADLGAMVYQSFKNNFRDSIDNFEANDGAADLFSFLKSIGTKVGLGTGMERELLNHILAKVKWDINYFDYVSCGDDFDFHRPMPDMILGMMKKFDVTNESEVLKVGDTVMDIREGKNAYVRTCAVLSGTQSEDVLLNEEPDLLVESLVNLRNYLEDLYFGSKKPGHVVSAL
jgi:phosphonatase-like hydrolase